MKASLGIKNSDSHSEVENDEANEISLGINGKSFLSQKRLKIIVSFYNAGVLRAELLKK